MPMSQEKRTVWKSGSDELIEVGSSSLAYVHCNQLTPEKLRDLAEAAAEAADALELVRETLGCKTAKVRIAE